MEAWRIPASIGVILGLCLLITIIDVRDRARLKKQGPYLVWESLSLTAKINIILACAALILASLLLICFPPWITAHQAEPVAKKALFLLETVAGNWSYPSEFPKEDAVSNASLSRLGIIALVMNAGSVYFLITILLGVLAVKRRQNMRLADAFNTRDATIQNYVVDTVLNRITDKEAALPADRKALRSLIRGLVLEAYREGDSVWKNKLFPPVLDGKDVTELMKSEI